MIEGWRGSTSEATVENNELLIVKGIKRRINHKYLRAISLVSKEKKELPESCAGMPQMEHEVPYAHYHVAWRTRNTVQQSVHLKCVQMID